MKKILFLSFSYPYGHFGPSDQCTTRIMEALVRTGKYEVHNISYSGEKRQYPIIDGVHLHSLGFKEAIHKRPRWMIRLFLMLKLPIYPYTKRSSSKRIYKICTNLIKTEHYDLVVAQNNPEESVMVGTWLKQNGYIDRLMIIFWDAIYGKLPRRIIPKQFSFRRQLKVENEIAGFADSLVSLYPLKTFHDQHGDVPNASGKRCYLGIPSVAQPKSLGESSYKHVIIEGKINMLYSGTIFRSEYVAYLVELLNKTKYAEKINLIFFSRGVLESDFANYRKNFRGTMQFSGWIPINELLALYPNVDYFLSFPGNPTAICSKVYEYMSYGKPLLLLYDDDNDVNVSTFSRYPVCLALDERQASDNHINRVEDYILRTQKICVPFDEVEKLFPNDTVSAYLDLIENMI